jgi:hypothetical protein
VTARKKSLQVQNQVETDVTNLLQEMNCFISVEPGMAAKAYLLEQMAEEKLEKPKAITVMRMLQYSKDKNKKVIGDCRAVREQLEQMKEFLAYDRKLLDKLTTGPI